MVKVLTRFWDKQFGYLLHPLEEGICLQWDTVKFRGIYTLHKGVKAEWYIGEKLVAVRYVQPFSLSGRGKCDRIVESPLESHERTISYPFD